MMTAIERAEQKQSQRLYRKIGRKFVQVNDPYAYDGLRDGWWLVRVEKGITTIREALWPKYAEVLAACTDFEDALVSALRKAGEARLRPHNEDVSEKEKIAFDAYCKALGETPTIFRLWYASPAEIAEKAVYKLTQKAGLLNDVQQISPSHKEKP